MIQYLFRKHTMKRQIRIVTDKSVKLISHEIITKCRIYEDCCSMLGDQFDGNIIIDKDFNPNDVSKAINLIEELGPEPCIKDIMESCEMLQLDVLVNIFQILDYIGYWCLEPILDIIHDRYLIFTFTPTTRNIFDHPLMIKKIRTEFYNKHEYRFVMSNEHSIFRDIDNRFKIINEMIKLFERNYGYIESDEDKYRKLIGNVAFLSNLYENMKIYYKVLNDGKISNMCVDGEPKNICDSFDRKRRIHTFVHMDKSLILTDPSKFLESMKVKQVTYRTGRTIN